MDLLHIHIFISISNFFFTLMEIIGRVNVDWHKNVCDAKRNRRKGAITLFDISGTLLHPISSNTTPAN